MKQRGILSFSLAVAICLQAPPLRPPAPPAGSASESDAPIELKLSPYAGVLRTVDVRVGELEGPFLFDTGGGSTVISLATAKAVGCTPFGRGTGFRHDGQRIDGQRAGPLAIRLGSYARQGEVGVLDLDLLLAGLPKLGGIASLETFAGRAITVELRRERILVETASSLEARKSKGKELQSRIARQAAGAALDVFVAIEGRHGPLWFEVDSGNAQPVLIAPHAFVELGLSPPAADRSMSVELPVRGLGNVKCDVMAKELIYDGLLNAEFCSRFALTFDLSSGRTWAAANE